jgi:hypothetical protein
MARFGWIATENEMKGERGRLFVVQVMAALIAALLKIETLASLAVMQGSVHGSAKHGTPTNKSNHDGSRQSSLSRHR